MTEQLSIITGLPINNPEGTKLGPTDLNSLNAAKASGNLLLTPLSQATEQIMSPLKLRDGERLVLWLNDKGTKFEAEIRIWSSEYIGNEGKIVPPHWTHNYTPSYDARNFWARIPEKTWLGAKDAKKENRYTLGLTDFTALVISASWPSDRIVFEKPDGTFDQLAALQYEWVISRFILQETRAQKAAEFKINGNLPPLPPDWIDHPKFPLSNYQKMGTIMSLGQEACGLFMDKGTGKTYTFVQRMCIEGIRKRNEENKMLRALIVVPQQVLMNWQEEIIRYAVTPGKVTICKGDLQKRAKIIVEGVTAEKDCNFSAIIISYDSMVATIDMLESIDNWDIICCDESHMFKSSATDRWKALRRLRDKSKYRVVMTGTPVGNIFVDLWTQLEFLGEGLSGFQDISKFKSFHGEWEAVQNAPGVSRLLMMKSTALLHERLARLTFAVTKAEAGLNLPDKVYDVYQVEMTARQAQIYKELALKIMIEIENDLTGDVDGLTAEHILTKLLRLAQITSGFVTWDAIIDPETGVTVRPKRIEQINAKNPKVEAVLELLTEEDRDPLGKTIIWAYFVEDIQTISKALKERGIKHGTYYGQTDYDTRDDNVRKFNSDPEFKVLVCNPQTAGEGLNLIGYDKNDPKSETYCDHEIFFSQNWSAILRSQAEDRAHRRGTRMPVRITDLTVPGTIDEEIRRRVQAKQSMAMQVTDIREILRTIVSD